MQIYNAAGQFVYETSTPTAGSNSCSSGNPVHLIICSGFEPIGSGGSPSSTRHIHLAGKQIARTKDAITTFVHTDLLGSVVAESTPAPAQITHRDLHEPYGAPSNGNYIQGPDYTGHVTDAASGLSYMQVRYYDPIAGRFLGTDPVHVDLNSGGNFNRYWYANDNPYTYVDPDGEKSRIAWLVRLTADGTRKVQALSFKAAVRARIAGKSVQAARERVAHRIERTAHGPKSVLKRHTGHDLKGKDGLPNGNVGRSHWQTDGKFGHTFYSFVAAALGVAADALDNVADAADELDPLQIRSMGDGTLQNQGTPFNLPGRLDDGEPQQQYDGGTKGYIEIQVEQEKQACTGTRIMRTSC